VGCFYIFSVTLFLFSFFTFPPFSPPRALAIAGAKKQLLVFEPPQNTCRIDDVLAFFSNKPSNDSSSFWRKEAYHVRIAAVSFSLVFNLSILHFPLPLLVEMPLSFTYGF